MQHKAVVANHIIRRVGIHDADHDCAYIHITDNDITDNDAATDS
jgi:hypothetical protein